MTRIEIHNDDFWIDGAPTYAGRVWRGLRVEGLLLNARMVQATFDDLNPATRQRFAYPTPASGTRSGTCGSFSRCSPSTGAMACWR